MWFDLMGQLDSAVSEHLKDGDGVYRPQSGVQMEHVPFFLDRDYQTYDENQLPQIVSTISIPSSTIAKSRTGDVFITSGREWKIHQTLEDDGNWRRLYVS
jgi:hypothetical protein